jgi:Pyruvate/2-oxoacid:ferredoxin oxidoreductase gamma subunit
MVLLGALLSTDRVPFKADSFVQIIQSRTPSKHLETNLKAFWLGREAAAVLAAGPFHSNA